MTTAGQDVGRHWFLCGFSGAGKSTVGPLLAAAAGRAFVDLDDEIARRAGQPAAALLSEQGEGAFRREERAALEDVVGRATGPLVVALGGGALETVALRRAVETSGTLAWLDVPLGVCLERLVADGTPRPVLDRTAGAGGSRAVEAFFARRAELYARAPVRVPADAPASAVAETALGLLDPRLDR